MADVFPLLAAAVVTQLSKSNPFLGDQKKIVRLGIGIVKIM